MDAATEELFSAVRTSDFPTAARHLAPSDAAAAFDELAARASRLEAELAAKSSRLAELEALVSHLEAENSHLRAMGAKVSNLELGSDAIGDAARVSQQEEVGIREIDPILGGNEHKLTEITKGALSCDDVIEISDGEDGVGGEERMAIDVKKGGSGEEGVLPVPTPRKRALRVVTSDSENEDGIEDAKEGDGSGKKRGVHDEDGEEEVLPTVTPSRKRALRVVTSDSENEDSDNGNDGGRMTADAKEEGVHTIPTPNRKRARRVVASDSENEEDYEDDSITIGEMLKKLRQGKVTEDVKELGDIEEDFSPPRRRSARLQRGESKSITPEEGWHREFLAKDQSKRRPAAYRKLNYTDSKEGEEEEDSLESEGDSLGGFLVNESDSVENASSSSEESSSKPGETDSDADYKGVMAGLRRERKTKNWEYEADMLSSFSKHPELCLKAVCALYRQQTSDEQSAKTTFVHNKRGFNQIDALRGSSIAQFLLDGDPYGPLKKTVQDLEEYDRYAFNFCHKLANRYSKQLFAIYQNKEDPYFLPS